ncbi:hypothetical protein D3C83_44180 [compost metagenome]
MAVITTRATLAIAAVAAAAPLVLPWIIDAAIAWPLWSRMALAVATLVPLGMLLGIPLPGGMRLLAGTRPDIVPWGWGLNGAFSVIGATLAVFIAMNWGFATTLVSAAAVYAVAAATLKSRG